MALKKIIIACNATKARIFNPDEKVDSIMANLLSYQVDGYEFTTQYQMSKWDGRSTYYSVMDGRFPVGFVSVAIQELKQEGYDVQLSMPPIPPALGQPYPKIDSWGYIDKYDYQPLTAEKLVKNRIMIARVSTGGGKTRIARICHARIGRRTLFLTTRKVLAHQMMEACSLWGQETGFIGDGEWRPLDEENSLNIAMVQTLALRLKLPDEKDTSADAIRQRRIRQKTIDFLKTVDLLIGEEAHEASGEGYFEVINHCTNAYYRLALTATPFMKNGGEDNMRLMAAFGDIGVNVSEKKLIDRGVLATPYFKFIPIKGKIPKLFKSTPWQRAQEVGIVNNEIRNKEIINHCLLMKKLSLSTMILVQRKEHGKILNQLLSKSGLVGEYIFGESSKAKRDKALKKLENGEIDYLIGSTILDVGVDVPSVGSVVNAGGGKAEVMLRQRIGRGLRAKKHGANVCLIVDFLDHENLTLFEHSQIRKNVIEKTPGFRENIVDDFDFYKLGIE